MKQRLVMLLVMTVFVFTSFAQELYVLNTRSQLEPLMRAVTSGTKIKGNALFAAYGGKIKSAMIIDGKSAELALPVGATYFYIKAPKNFNVRTWKLTKLDSKKKNRELVYSKTGAFSGTESDIEEIELIKEKLSDNTYFVKPKELLQKGEYALFRMDMGVPIEIYDFRVDPSLSPALQIPESKVVLAELEGEENNIVNEPQVNDKKSIVLSAPVELSDVDKDIPLTNKVASNTFALVISNENYKQVEKVPFAINDGRVFKQYLQMAIGIPEKHITHIEDASLSDIKYALNRLNEICEAYEGEVNIIVHYSGHGIPSESSKEAYLLPVDGYGADVTTALKVSDFYKQLSMMKTQGVVVFLDACFSGTQKSGDMLMSARGVAIKVRDEIPMENLVVISAAQGDQTAYPYNEKQHGLMTYFLLKKLQENKGDVTLGELSDYIVKNVKRISIVEQGKSQVPSVSYDSSNTKWREIRVR